MKKTDEEVGVSWKQVMTMLAGLTVLAGLHASFVVPAIMNRVSDMIDQKIEIHLRVTHPDSVTRRELNLTVGKIEAKLEGVSEQLNRVLDKLDK
jgi:hypothetical protein